MNDSEELTQPKAVTQPGGLDGIVKALATGLYFGCSRFAPGTVGALWGVGIYALLAYLRVGFFAYVAVMVVLIAAAIPICGRAEKLFGEKDCRKIVLDEIVSIQITFLPVYCLITSRSMAYYFNYWIAVGFVLNRLFDIVKIWLARRAQKLSGGWGVVLDDVVAGVQSCIVMNLALWLTALLFYR